MQKYEKYLDKYFWLVIIILSLPSYWALSVPGFFGASDDLHVGWLYEMVRTINAGQIPPRYVPDLSFGFGYPLFNFVFPLPFYIGALVHFLGLSLVDSVKAVFLLSLPLSGIALYPFLRRHISALGALAGAIIYIYTPYRANDIYNRGALGESLSFVFLPIILTAIDHLTSSNSKSIRWISAGGLAVVGLVLSHNIATYMFLPFASAYAILRLFISNSRINNIKSLVLMGIIGLSGSGYFWLPALLDSQLVKYDTVFNFIDHFPTLRQLFIPFWGYGASVAGPYDGMSFFMGSANLILCLLSVGLLMFFWSKYNSGQRILILWGIGTVAASIAIMNYRSTILWENIPLLPYFQFPWRFLMMTTLGSCILICCLDILRSKSWLLIAAMFVVIGLNYSFFQPNDYLGRTDSYYLNRYIPVPEPSSEYLNIQEEYLRLPKDTQKRPDKVQPLVSIDNGTISNLSSHYGLRVTAEVTATQTALLTFSKYNWPGWQAEINNKPVDIQTQPPYGAISFEVPAGQHQIEIKFKETPLKMFLDIVSIVVIIGAALLALFNWSLFERIRR